MQKFVEDARMVSLVREKLLELFNHRGREAMREQLRQYIQQVLEPAISTFEDGDEVRRQFEVELAELEEVMNNLKLPKELQLDK